MKNSDVLVAAFAAAIVSLPLAIGFIVLDRNESQSAATPATDPAAAVQECREQCETAGLEMFEVVFAVDGAMSECRCSAVLEDLE